MKISIKAKVSRWKLIFGPFEKTNLFASCFFLQIMKEKISNQLKSL